MHVEIYNSEEVIGIKVCWCNNMLIQKEGVRHQNVPTFNNNNVGTQVTLKSLILIIWVWVMPWLKNLEGVDKDHQSWRSSF